MTSVDLAIQTYLPQFFATAPFNQLSDAQQKRLSPKLQLCTFRFGQVIYAPGELPIAVHLILQGRVRILATTPDQPTIAIAGQGTLIGWDSLLRRVPSGTIRAAASPDVEAVQTIALPADEFEAIALDLLPHFAHPSLLEQFDTLSGFLAKMPTRFSDPQLKEIVDRLDRNQTAIIQNWHSTQGDFHLNGRGTISENRTWLYSGGAPLDLPIGTAIAAVDQISPVRSSAFPVRLLGIDRAFLAAILQGTVPPDLPFRGGGDARSRVSTGSPAATQPPADPRPADTPPPVQTRDLASLPDTPASTGKPYPIRKSPTANPIEDLVACFSMVCDRLQVPYRPDSLRRWLTERFGSADSVQTLDDFDPYDLGVRIGQAIGLEADMVRFTPSPGGLDRLETPALICYRDIFVVLHEANRSTVTIGSPRTGLLRLSPKDFAARLAPVSDGGLPICRAIVLSRQAQTPIDRFGFKWFIPALAKHRGVLVQVLIASMFVQLLGLANPLLVQQVIDNVIVSANLDAMTTFGILMILFASLEGILTIVRMYLFASTTHRVDLLLGGEIIRHLLRLPLTFFEKRPVGELAARLSELENIRQFLTGTSLTVVLDVIFSVLYIGVMFLYSVRLTICVLLTVPVVIASTLLVAAIQQKLIRAKADRNSKVQSYLIEILGGIFTVKAQHMESLVETTWRDRYVRYLSTGFTTATVSTLFSSFSQFLSTVSNLIVLWVGAGAVLQGELTLGGLIAFRILNGYVTSPLLRLAGLWQRVQETSLSIELLADIMNTPAEALPEADVHLQLPPLQGDVQYHGVSFGFKPGQQQLQNVDLDIPAGAFVAIVGQSGSGKSTLLKLLPRLYVPQSGTITIDGYDVNKVNLDSLRSQVGIVPQDAVLFEGSIRDNIALFQDLPDSTLR